MQTWKEKMIRRYKKIEQKKARPIYRQLDSKITVKEENEIKEERKIVTQKIWNLER